MHFSTALVAGLLATSAAATAGPNPNLEARRTKNSSKCAKSLSALTTKAPTPTDKSLSSLLSGHTGIISSVPASLQHAFCTYDRSLASFVGKSVVPLVSSCRDYLGASSYSFLSSQAKDAATTQGWCSSVTKNAAGPLETGYVPGVIAAAGLVAAVL